jgi:hypothetical protein
VIGDRFVSKHQLRENDPCFEAPANPEGVHATNAKAHIVIRAGNEHAVLVKKIRVLVDVKPALSTHDHDADMIFLFIRFCEV